MIVIFKNEEGTYSIRPAFIGFIENNIIRRTLCTVFYPLVLLFTIAFNLLQASFVSLFLLVRAVWHPISEVKPVWKTELWKRPRTKDDKHKRMN